MLKVFKTDSITKKVKKLKKIQIDSWIELTSPTNDEIQKVVDRTKVDIDLIRKMLDTEELPRVEQSDNGTLVVIDTPYIEGEDKYTTYPLGIKVTNNNYVITVSPKKVSILDDFKTEIVEDNNIDNIKIEVTYNQEGNIDIKNYKNYEYNHLKEEYEEFSTWYINYYENEYNFINTFNYIMKNIENKKRITDYEYLDVTKYKITISKNNLNKIKKNNESIY